MLDIGWSELVLIGVVALIVVGPKDLPRMFHALGRVTAKARGMAREFQRAMDDAAKSSGLDEVKKDLNGLQTGLKAATNPSSLGINALEDAARKFEKWDPKTVMRPGAAAAAVAPAAAATAPAAAAPAAELGPETKALAEKRAAEAAASRAKALELQAKAAASTSAGFAAKAKAEAEAAAMTQADDSAAAPAPKPRAPRAKKAGEAVEAAAAQPAKKPPVRRKKSDA